MALGVWPRMSDEAITFRKFDHHPLNTHPVSSKPIGDAFTFTSVWRRWNSSQQLDTDSVLAEGVGTCKRDCWSEMFRSDCDFALAFGSCGTDSDYRQPKIECRQG